MTPLTLNLLAPTTVGVVLTLRPLMSYIYIYIYRERERERERETERETEREREREKAPILDVSRSHTTTQHSR